MPPPDQTGPVQAPPPDGAPLAEWDTPRPVELQHDPHVYHRFQWAAALRWWAKSAGRSPHPATVADQIEAGSLTPWADTPEPACDECDDTGRVEDAGTWGDTTSPCRVCQEPVTPPAQQPHDAPAGDDGHPGTPDGPAVLGWAWTEEGDITGAMWWAEPLPEVLLVRPEVGRVLEAAQAWVARTHEPDASPPNLWADREDLALIAAVDALDQPDSDLPFPVRVEPSLPPDTLLLVGTYEDEHSKRRLTGAKLNLTPDQPTTGGPDHDGQAGAPIPPLDLTDAEREAFAAEVERREPEPAGAAFKATDETLNVEAAPAVVRCSCGAAITHATPDGYGRDGCDDPVPADHQQLHEALAAAEQRAEAAEDRAITASAERQWAADGMCRRCGHGMPAAEPASGPAGTTITVPDSPKMLRETLCVAQMAVGQVDLGDSGRQHIAQLGRLIDECDRHRPLGPDGKHGNRHTATCGCDPARCILGGEELLEDPYATWDVSKATDDPDGLPDRAIVPLVEELRERGIVTLQSCIGHLEEQADGSRFGRDGTLWVRADSVDGAHIRLFLLAQPFDRVQLVSWPEHRWEFSWHPDDADAAVEALAGLLPAAPVPPAPEPAGDGPGWEREAIAMARAELHRFPAMQAALDALLADRDDADRLASHNSDSAMHWQRETLRAERERDEASAELRKEAADRDRLSGQLAAAEARCRRYVRRLEEEEAATVDARAQLADALEANRRYAADEQPELAQWKARAEWAEARVDGQAWVDLEADRDRLRALVGDEDQPGWNGCSRAEAIRQCNEKHEFGMRMSDALETVKGELAEVRDGLVEARSAHRAADADLQATAATTDQLREALAESGRLLRRAESGRRYAEQGRNATGTKLGQVSIELEETRAELKRLGASQDAAHDDLAAILRELGLGDQARSASPQQVVRDEVLPAIRRLREQVDEMQQRWKRAMEDGDDQTVTRLRLHRELREAHAEIDQTRLQAAEARTLADSLGEKLATGRRDGAADALDNAAQYIRRVFADGIDPEVAKVLEALAHTTRTGARQVPTSGQPEPAPSESGVS